MCDENTQADLQKAATISRRQFSAIGMGAGLLAALPQVANAYEIAESEVEIKTSLGTCDAHFVHPVSGAHAAVLVWPDIFGLRPAFRVMGRRLAESGYAVLTVNPFYRVKRAPTSTPGVSLSDPGVRESIQPLRDSITAQTVITDTEAFVAWLDTQKAVDASRKIGTTGYCMGGPIVMRAAAAVPGRIGAGASFHGGGLNTDGPDSPHLLIPRMRAGFLIAIADNDDQRDPASKDILRKAFDDAGVPAEIEVYKDALHGWCAIDSQAYHPAQAAKAWWRMLHLFESRLA